MFKFVAEIGNNHLGDINLAKAHIDAFAKSGAKYFKFQKRTIKDLLTEEEYNTPHPNPDFAHGDTYGKHREALELNIEQHIELFNYCRERDLNYACSSWDCNSARELVAALPDMSHIKIPSACNLNFEMLDYIYDNSKLDVHISLGMTTDNEAMSIVNFVKKQKAEKRTVLYACVSGYPVPYDSLCLLYIKQIQDMCENKFAGIGYSGHELGISIAVAAATLGATWIEKHVVTCRSTIRHTDAPASLEPEGVRRLVRDLDNLHAALTYKPNQILDIEIPQHKKLKRNV